MTYEDFLKVVKDCYTLTHKEFEDTINNIDQWSRERDQHKDLDNTTPYVLYSEECIGGIEGGNCWESGGHRSFTNPEGADECRKNIDTMLDGILTEVNPDISYLKYKDLASLIEHTSKTRYEYYGNSSEYLIMYIEIRKLYDKLEAM